MRYDWPSAGHALSRIASRDRSLRVALVSTQLNWGGGEQQLRLLAEGLRRRGHLCRVFARYDGAFAKVAADDGFEIVPLAGNGRSPRQLWKIRSALRHWRPDILHMNDPHALSGAGIAALGLGISARVASRRVSFPIRRPSSYRRLCDRVICVSQSVRDICQRSGIPAWQTCLVHDGVDPYRARSGNRRRGRTRLGIDDSTFLLLAVGRLTEAKGHSVLLNALPLVLARHSRVQLALAGDGELAKALSFEVQRLNLDVHVRLLGFRTDVPDLMRAADLIVMPSLVEGLGSSLIDAMMAGVPIVATMAGGIGDLLQPAGVARPFGFLVPPGDDAALARAICMAIDDPTERARRTARAEQHALAHFTTDQMVENTLVVYRALQAAGRAAA